MTKRVLIIEDEQDVADLVAEVLHFEGYETRIVNGPRAMREALSFRPDVVLLDLMMPIVDGFQVARQLRTDPATRGLPIIVMTAMHEPAVRAVEVGTPLVLAKPFDIGELVETVDQAVGSRSS